MPFTPGRPIPEAKAELFKALAHPVRVRVLELLAGGEQTMGGLALHTGVASGMVVAYGILAIRLPHWIPGMPRTFVLLGWLFLAVTLTLALLFFVEYYTLTAVELVAGILVFAWIILFIRNADALHRDSDGTDPTAS